MTVKEASIRFNLNEKEIRKRQRDNMIIGIRKDGRSVVIPDNTEIRGQVILISDFKEAKQCRNNYLKRFVSHYIVA